MAKKKSDPIAFKRAVLARTRELLVEKTEQNFPHMVTVYRNAIDKMERELAEINA